MTYKNSFLLTHIFIACFGVLEAQSDVVTTGGDYSGTGGSVAFSIGQVAYTNLEGATGRASLGVQQPLVVMMVGINDLSNHFTASIYPNPVNTSVNLRLEELDGTSGIENISIGLYDVNGNLVIQKKVTDIITSIPLDHLAGATYLLRITQHNSEIQTFKIIKTN